MVINDQLDPDLAQQAELRQAAYHEAGHAVIARVLGIPVNYIELTIERNFRGYWVDRWNGIVRPVDGTRDRAKRRRIAFAGIVTESRSIDTLAERDQELAQTWAQAIVTHQVDEDALLRLLGHSGGDIEWPDEDIRIVAQTFQRPNAVAQRQCTEDLNWTIEQIDKPSIWHAIDTVAKELLEGPATRRTYVRYLSGVAFESMFDRSRESTK